MDQAQKQVKAFLQTQQMDPAEVSIEPLIRSFIQEMEQGLADPSNGLAMLPTYIEINRPIPCDEPVIVMDAGGTHFRVAVVRFQQDGQPQIEHLESHAMPGLKQEVSKEAFFTTMVDYLRPVLDKSSRVGFCFSYPVEMGPDKDGELLVFSKEIKAPEVVGQRIGANLNATIQSMGCGDPKQIVLLNDTVATLLAGRGNAQAREHDSYIGFILGTGTNTSYVESNPHITKIQGLDSEGHQIINVESGAFSQAPRGQIDQQLDAASNNPGVHQFEKMISGAYLGQVCLRTLQAAAQAGLFTPTTQQALQALTSLETKDVSIFMAHPLGRTDPLSQACDQESDNITLYYLIDALLERAAKFTAANLCSAVIKSGKGHNPCRPVGIVAEGTTFYKLTSVRPRVEYHLRQCLTEQRGLHWEILNLDNATLIGAAIAGLTN